MNKVIITGRPVASCGELEALLGRYGMSRARPSRREGLMPAEVSDAIIHASRGLSGVGQPLTSFEPVEPAPVWKELLLDLLLGNSDQKWWGWADPECLPLLDFWSEWDAHAVFVLVYDEPYRVFDEPMPDAAKGAGGELFAKRLADWAAYNRALLRFFFRNPDRCLLVNARQVMADETLFISQARARLGIESKEKLDPNRLVASAKPSATPDSWGDSASLVRACEALFHMTGKPDHDVMPLLRAEAAERLIIAQHLAEKPELLEIYQELQSASNMPLDAGPSSTSLSDAAWQSLADLRQGLAAVLGHAAESHRSLNAREVANQHESGLLRDQMDLIRKELENQYLQSLDISRKSEEAALQQKARIEQLRRKHEQQLEAQRQRMLASRMKFEERIEKQQIKIGKLRSRIEWLEKSRAKAKTEAKRPTGAATRVRNQLSYRLGAVVVANSRSVTGWLGMPFALIREHREFKQAKLKAGNTKLPPLRDYADWEEAKRIQNHLSYRLGNILVEKGRSPAGWCSLPFALLAEKRRFQKTKGKPGATSPPPI